MTSNALWFSRQLISTFNPQVSLYHADRIPRHEPLVIVSNHRSFMDPFLLMVALGHPIHFACHRYMGQVPILKDMVEQMGAFPLDSRSMKHQVLFEQASKLLQAKQAVGIFPEGTRPMVETPQRDQLRKFHRGFAHLLMRSPVTRMTVLPVAIASCEESVRPLFPLRLLHWFDPSEPLFDENRWHPLVVYHRVNVLVGQPIRITEKHREDYRGRQARAVVNHLNHHCHSQVEQLLQKGFHL